MSDRLGLVLSLSGALLAVLVSRRRTPAAVRDAPASRYAALEECGLAPPPPRRWGALVPVGLLVLMVGLRLTTLLPEKPASVVEDLYERASRAYAEGRFDDAAEYIRHALTRTNDPGLRPELLCLRGESLLRLGDGRASAAAFEEVLQQSNQGPYTAQALFGLAQALEASGERERARSARERLRREHPRTPWAARLPDDA